MTLHPHDKPDVPGREPPRRRAAGVRGESKLRELVAGLLGVLTFVVQLAQRQERSALLWYVVKGAVVFALVLGTWGLVSSLTTRRHLGHWRHPEVRPLLRRELAFIVLLLTVAGAGLLLPASPFVALGVAVAFIFVCWFGDPLSQEIARTLSVLHVPTVTEDIGGRRPYRWLGNEDTVKQAAAGEDAGAFQRFIGWWFERPPGQLVSRMRIVAAAMLLGLALSALGAGGAGIVGEYHDGSRHALVQHARPHARKARARLRIRPRRVVPAALSTPLSPRQTNWLAQCGRDADPGKNAPEEWAKLVLYDLYLGGPWLPPRVDPPGAVGGCTGPVYAPQGTSHFYYTFGTMPATGELRSVAVATQRFQSAIFIAPAVAPVIALIHRYGEIGGYARLDVGPANRGDCYAIQTAAGMVMLVRVAKTLAHGVAGQYVELPPPVTAAWWDAMSARRSVWLWPIEQAAARGKVSFRLVADPIANTTVETIAYDKHTGIATRDTSSGPLTYGPGGVTFSEAALIDRAASAR
jgi:hypothetical protein